MFDPDDRSTPQLGGDGGAWLAYRGRMPDPDEHADPRAAAHDRQDLVLAGLISAAAFVIVLVSGVLVVVGGV